MPKQYSSKDIVSFLLDLGFIFISQKGSHAKYRKGEYTAIVPMGQKEVLLGTLRSILRQAGLDKSDLPRH